jgi:hypothetical protein
VGEYNKLSDKEINLYFVKAWLLPVLAPRRPVPAADHPPQKVSELNLMLQMNRK